MAATPRPPSTPISAQPLGADLVHGNGGEQPKRSVRGRKVGETTADELLRKLLMSFGLDSAPLVGVRDDKRLRRSLSGESTDSVARVRRYREEVEQARPVVTDLLRRLDALRQAPRLPSPAEYAATFHAIHKEWNRVVYDAEWLSLPTLCESCGIPVLLRAPERNGGSVDVSTVCSEVCRNRRRVERAAAKRTAAKLAAGKRAPTKHKP